MRNIYCRFFDRQEQMKPNNLQRSSQIIMLHVAVTPKNINMMIISSMLIECYLLPPAFVLYEVNVNLLKSLFLFLILDVRRMNTSLFNNSTTRTNKRTFIHYTSSVIMHLSIYLMIYLLMTINQEILSDDFDNILEDIN